MIFIDQGQKRSMMNLASSRYSYSTQGFCRIKNQREGNETEKRY